uniref:lytic transglycosylase domain-containing protein n=1 Tax=Burkholderia arboris TaxID=488730 RepID=UPI003BEF403E
MNAARTAFAIAAMATCLAASAGARADCLDDAAAWLSVDSQLVHAIAYHESGMRADAINRNRDGSRDIGLMQINSSWLPTLARSGISETDLFNPCVNAWVGTWILRGNIDRLGPTWKAVGAYNAVSPAKQLRYANRIYPLWQAIRLANPPLAVTESK